MIVTNQVEFSEVFQTLNAIKEGDASKKECLVSIIGDFKEGKNSKSFLDELGRTFIVLGIEELFKYANSKDLQYIGKLTKEDWDNLATKNKGKLPRHLANHMTASAKREEISTNLSLKWDVSKKEIEKHLTPMARYITEGLIDVID